MATSLEGFQHPVELVQSGSTNVHPNQIDNLHL